MFDDNQSDAELERTYQLAIAKYVNAASDLAENVKKDVQKRGYISDKTLKSLNDFQIASHALGDLKDFFEKLNETIN